MTKLRRILCGCVGLYIFAALSLVQAQNAPGPGGPPPGGHPGQGIQEIFNQLNLTDDQKNRLEATKHQHRVRMESTRQAMKALRAALHEQLMSTQLDMARVNELHGQIKALLCQTEDDKLHSILAVRSILTPEQFTKFVELMHKRKQEHKE
jgi:Spy/CpxP family protein refolding chaperone